MVAEKGLVYSRSILRKLSVRLDRCFVSTMLKAKDSLKNCYQYTFGSLQCSETLQVCLFGVTFLKILMIPLNSFE